MSTKTKPHVINVSEQIKLAQMTAESQKESNREYFINNAKNTSLETSKLFNQRNGTVDDLIKDANTIYQWLIKDLV